MQRLACAILLGFRLAFAAVALAFLLFSLRCQKVASKSVKGFVKRCVLASILVSVYGGLLLWKRLVCMLLLGFCSSGFGLSSFCFGASESGV